MPTVSRGARRCLALLQSYAAVSGRAFPYQATLAAKLDVSPRTVRRYLHELAAAGLVVVKKRQHSSAEYRLQTGQNVRSGVRSGVRSERRYKERVLVSAEEMWPKSPAESQPNPEWDEIVKWATEYRMPLETGGDVLRVHEAMLATRKRPAGREESYRCGADTARDGADRPPAAAGAS